MNSTIHDPSITAVDITRSAASGIMHTADLVATEEPLEIIIAWPQDGSMMNKNISVTMRTPGNDAALAAGFLFTEAIIKNASEIKEITTLAFDPNKILVSLQDNAAPNLQQTDRNFYTSSSCGVCGKASIDAIKTVSAFRDLKSNATILAETLYSLPALLRKQQQTFDQTGGLHAAALFSPDGSIKLLQEDVGRHNALDKLIGMAFMKDMLPLSEAILLLSGRASFELIQKATMAGITIVAAVGAPSSLAVQLAQETGVTLVGFLRNNGCNIYSHPERIIFPA
ncbi:MAG: formate dehydrogenase accessory sulfurtransferase FdhD [Ferruginibacter sp.]